MFRLQTPLLYLLLGLAAAIAHAQSATVPVATMFTPGESDDEALTTASRTGPVRSVAPAADFSGQQVPFRA